MESPEDPIFANDKRNIPNDRGDLQPSLPNLSGIRSTLTDASTDQQEAMPTAVMYHDEPPLIPHHKAFDSSFNGDADPSLTLSDEPRVWDSNSNPTVLVEHSLNGTLADESKINTSHFPDVYFSTTSLLPSKTSSGDDDSAKTFGDESQSSNDTCLNSEKSFNASDSSAPVHFNLDGDSQQSAGEPGQLLSSDEPFYADTNDSFVSLDQCDTVSPKQHSPVSLDPISPVTGSESPSETAHCSESTFTAESRVNRQSESPSCAVTWEVESHNQVSTTVEDNGLVEQMKSSFEAEPKETMVLVKHGGAVNEDPPVVAPLRSNGLDHCGSAMGSPHSAFRKWSPPIESSNATDGDSQSKGADVILDNHTTENPQPGPLDIYDEELENLGNSRTTTPTASSPFTSPIDFSRYSPAHVVAATGGASAAILRRLQSPSVGGDISRTSFTFKRVPSPQQNLITAQGLDVEPEAVVPPMLNLTLSDTPELLPAKQEDVESSSERILGSFIIETYRHEHETQTQTPPQASSSHDQPATTRSPVARNRSEIHDNLFGPEFASIPRAAPDSLEAQVASRLAQLGDEIDRAYGHRLDRMIGCLPLTECPVQTFCEVARVLFSWGPTNWGQVVALFCFGYRLIIRRVRSGLLDAFHQVCRCLISFCRQVNVFAWIALQGGWQIVQYLTLGNRTDTRAVLPTDNQPPASLSTALWFPASPQQSWYWFAGLAVLCTALVVHYKLVR